MTFGSNCGSAAIFASNSSHAFIGKRCKQGSNGEGVSTRRASLAAANTSRKRDGKLVRPFASIACSKCPRNIDPRPCLPLRGYLRHYLPLYPTMLLQGTGESWGVSILCDADFRRRSISWLAHFPTSQGRPTLQSATARTSTIATCPRKRQESAARVKSRHRRWRCAGDFAKDFDKEAPSVNPSIASDGARA